MKNSLLVSILLGLGFLGFSQGKAPLSMGEKQLSFGITGVGTAIPVYANLEIAVHDDVTVGPAVSLNFLSGNTSLKLGAIGNYHWNTLIGIPSNFDFYAGLNAGFKLDFDDSKNNRFDVGGQVGGRWYWSEKWGLNVEFGVSGGLGGGLGLTYKL